MKLFGWFRKDTDNAETRSNLRNPADWLINWTNGGYANSSGQPVSPETATRVSAYFACIRVVSESFGKLPIHTYRGNEDGTRTKLTNYIDRVMRKPNPYMDAMAFKEIMIGNALSWGNGYAEIVRDNSGRVIELWPINPQYVTPYLRKTGEIVYEVKDSDAQRQVLLTARQMFHIHGIGPDGYTGYSIAERAKEGIGIALSAQKSVGSFYKNGSRLGGVLQCPTSLEDQARKNLKESWVSAFSGTENSGKTPLLEEGITFQPIQIKPEDAQFIAAMKFQVEDIARWFGVPPHKIQDLSRSTFNNIEHQSIQFAQDAIQPWAVRFEEQVSSKLISDPSVFIEVNLDALLRADAVSRYDAYSKQIASLIRTPNEIRALENLPPVDGGDTLFGNGGLASIDKLMADADKTEAEAEKAAEPTPEPVPMVAPVEPEEAPEAERSLAPAIAEKLAQANLGVLASAYEHLLSMEADKATRAAKKDQLAEWADEFYSTHPESVRARIGDSLEAHARGLWGLISNKNMPDWAETAVQEFISTAAKRHAETSRESVELGINEKDFNRDRAELFAMSDLTNLGINIINMIEGEK